MKLHISNLPPDATEEELRDLFSQFGKVKRVNIIKFPEHLSGDYGFIDAPAPAGFNKINNNKKLEINSIEKINCRN